MKIEYKDTPDRGVIERIVDFDFPGQSKWNIPEACVIKIAVVGRPPNRKGSPVPNIPGAVPTTVPEKLAQSFRQLRSFHAGILWRHFSRELAGVIDIAENWSGP